MKCPTCGKRIPSDVPVCKHCGKRIPRPKKKGAKPKTQLLSQLSQRQLLIAWMAGMFIFIALILAVLPHGGTRKRALKPERFGAEITIERSKVGAEVAPNAVYGEVIAAHVGTTITVRSLHTGTVYTFSVGRYTSYHPRRYPAIGERVKAYYRSDDDLMKVTQVIIDQ